MKSARQLVNRIRSGAIRPLALAYLLGLAFTIGYLGLLSHKYEHFTDAQPELTCHLCIAGDTYTPVAELPAHAEVLTAESARPRDRYEAPYLRAPRTAHSVRAPPVTA